MSVTTQLVNEPSLVSQGVELLIAGMGTVFVFLMLLIIVTSLMSALITRFAPEEPAEPARPMPAPASAVTDPQLLQVIQEAVRLHRNHQK